MCVCVHTYTHISSIHQREVAMGDATSRLSRQDAASALQHYAAALERADAAVRVGRDLGVSRGADAFLDAHNEVIYGIAADTTV